jgi:hypothetical protein
VTSESTISGINYIIDGSTLAPKAFAYKIEKEISTITSQVLYSKRRSKEKNFSVEGIEETFGAR